MNTYETYQEKPVSDDKLSGYNLKFRQLCRISASRNYTH